MHVVDRGDLGDDVHRHLVVVPGRGRDVQAPEGVLGHVGRRLAEHVELARCPPRSSARGGPRPCPATRCPARARRRPAGGGRLRRTRRCPSAAHYRRPGRSRCLRRYRSLPGRGEGSGEGRTRRWRHVHHSVEATCRPHRPDGRRMAVHRPRPRRGPRTPAVAGRDPGLSCLVLGAGTGTGPPPCPTPCDVVEHMRRASGRRRARGGRPPGPGDAPGGGRRPLRLPDARAGPAPGPRRRWQGSCAGARAGNGGTARSSSGSSSRRRGSPSRSGPGRTAPTPSSTSCPPSAAACGASCSAPRTSGAVRPARSRRGGGVVLPLGDRPRGAGPDARRPARRRHARPTRSQVLYAHHVLGYSIAELAAMTGRDRRALYARRDRGQRRLCA